MALSLNFKVMGIDIELHWSFLLLLLLILVYAGIDAALSIVFLFLFVILHELSHSYVAIRNGIEVKKITLFPIGGMSMIEDVSIPPDVEFKIAIAGPLFNFIVIAIMLPLLFLINDDLINSFILMIIEINVVLGLFNLLPAIPLDGGRVWRSWREKKVGHLRATADAVRLSRFSAIMLLLVSFMVGVVSDDYELLVWNFIIAAVIYLGSQAEFSIALLQDSAKGIFVRDAMNYYVISINPNLKLNDASSLMLSTHSPTLIVSGKPIRLVEPRHLLGVGREKWGKTKVAEVAQPSPVCTMDEPILEAWKKMKFSDLSTLPVVSHETVIGTISEIDIEKMFILNRIRV